MISTKSKKKDIVIDSFKIKDGKNFCLIGNCNKKFSVNTSKTVLKKHLQKKHKYEIASSKQNEQVDEKNIEISKNAHSLNPTENDVYEAFSKVFSSKSLPYTLIDNKNFIYALNLYKKTDVTLTKYKLRDTTLQMGKKNEREIIAKLSANRHPVTLAIDGWTNVRSNKVTNLLLISNGTSYYHSSIENKETKNDAEWLSSQVGAKIGDLINDGVNIIAITTDNENLMKATCKKLKEKYPFLIDIPCAAHLMQLCLKTICEIPKIKEIISEISRVVDMIKYNKENSVKLETFQRADGSEILKVIRYIEIRWTSLIGCTERLLSLKKYINVVITDLSEIFWKNVSDLFVYLKPFQEYINKIQMDNASLYCVS